ncbi:helix-turn-helix domain-containing protein [Vibrio sp. M260118]|uniref:helix-turn-helix domain-containing protein n=1 Tax=Vibrio sp. M260118 TaxID=3020896 RepID=UPI002F3FCC01
MPKLSNNTYSINQYFTQLRIARGETQKDVSKQTGIPYRTVQRLEQHRAVINAEQIERLCEHYGINLLDMARGTIDLRPIQDRELLEHLKRLPVPVKKSITQLVKVLSRSIE